MKFKHKLLLTSVSLNREKAGEGQGDLGSTLVLSAGVKLDDLDGLVGDKATTELLKSLYNDQGDLLTNNVSALSIGIVHQDVKATLRGAGATHTFPGGKIDSIALTPKLSRVVDVKMKLKVHPTEEQTGWLGKVYGYELACQLESNKNQIPGDDEDQANLPLPDKDKPGKGDKDKAGAKDRLN